MKAQRDKRSVLKKILFVLLGVTCAVIISILILGLTADMPGEEKTPAGHTRNQALYIPMRDGVQIAIDVWVPVDLAPGRKVPTIIRSTRYWRCEQMGFVYRVLIGLGRARQLGSEEADRLNNAGYALVTVDARGSGASFGQRPIEFSNAEVADLGEVSEWIASQPWSNGRVASYGTSYDGNTAEYLAVPNHPAVKAVAPQFSDLDPVLYLAMPGGVLNRGFVEEWGKGNLALDANDICAAAEVGGLRAIFVKSMVPGVKPVDTDKDGRQRAQAVASHNTMDLLGIMLQHTYRDEALADVEETADDITPFGRQEQIESSGAAMYVWVSWLDAGTVDGALSRFLTFSNPQKVIIGAWSHGGRRNADPFLPADAPPDPSSAEQHKMLVEFFDNHLKDDGSGIPERGVTYCTLGEGGWNVTDTWPPAGFAAREWYFGADGLLTPDAPISETAADEYAVDFTATTGDSTRWHTQLGGGDVVYPDRAEEDKKLLTYTSLPMETDVEITGTPIVTLYAASTETDGAFHAYLEDVAPDGRVTYITEGIIRAIHRKVSEEEPPYVQLAPYHSYKKADGMPLVPGEVAEVTFNLYTTSVLIRKGHRIRIAVAGHDASWFARYPAEGTPTLHVQRNTRFPSKIVLPMKQRTL